MSFKPINYDIIPTTLKQCMYTETKDGFGENWLLIMPFTTTTLINSTDEYVILLEELMTKEFDNRLNVSPYEQLEDCLFINSYIYKNYGNRKILKKYFNDFEVYENINSNFAYLVRQIMDDIKLCVDSNLYKWSQLLKSTVLEFNPLWNVDGTETTTRTLEQDGTVTNARSGTLQNAHSGTDGQQQSISGTYGKTGTETDAKTGTNTDVHTGTDTVVDSGTVGVQHSGNDTTTNSKTTTEGTTFYDTDKSVLTRNTNDTTTTNMQKTDTKNLSDSTTFGETNTLTHNTTDSESKTVQTTDTYNSSNTETRNLSDLETRDLLDTERIILERHGNIGVTTTTKLLQEFRDYVNFNVVDIIAKDIVNSITEGVY